jgi:hypothetical protein
VTDTQVLAVANQKGGLAETTVASPGHPGVVLLKGDDDRILESARRYGFHGTPRQHVSDANGVTALGSSLLDEIVRDGASDACCGITGRGRRPAEDIHPKLPNNIHGNVNKSLRSSSRVLYKCLDVREEYSCERETQAAKYQTHPR